MQRQTSTGIDGNVAWYVAHRHELDGVLPHEAEIWTHLETDIPWGLFLALRAEDFIHVVDRISPTQWRSDERVCKALRRDRGEDATPYVSTEHQ